jgi:sulfite exporter TauE/SafE
MISLSASLTIGFLGSLHCLGMCGPLVLAYSLHLPKADTPSWSKGLLHHGLFHIGRMLSYGLLGALAAALFHAADLGRILFNIRVNMTLLGGVFMIALGLGLLRLIPLPAQWVGSPWGKGSWLSRWIPHLLRSDRVWSKMALGFATGFLPCGLSWAMIVTAATTQNPVAGFLTMAAFGLGTVPALLLTGISSSLVSLRMRLLGERAAALSVTVMGLVMVFKGARALV